MSAEQRKFCHEQPKYLKKLEALMKQQHQDLRTQISELVLAGPGESISDDHRSQIAAQITFWLASLDEEDLADIPPDSLASVLWEGFSRVARRSRSDCQIEARQYENARGFRATALLIVNPDMPFLVDSIVMALRRMRIETRAVLNAVLSVQRAANGEIAQIMHASADGPLESYVLCLLAEELPERALSRLVAAIRGVVGDVAAVHRDTSAMLQRMSAAGVASAAHDCEGQEVSAFLEWAGNGGFESFGYGYYQVVEGETALIRDLPSRIGVLKDTSHPVYGTCLAGIPDDFKTLAGAGALSIVKADVQSTLHRDQQLDFIGVRDTDGSGAVRGEHCFVGLFSRAAAATPLEQLPFARIRVKNVLQLAGVRQQGFRSEKFLEILESLPRTEVLEADPHWLAQVCSSVVALYKQPRAKVFARHDLYGRHLNVLVYLPQERYSASLAARLARTLRRLSGATEVRAQTLVADGPLARVFLIAHAARRSPELSEQIEQALLTAVEGWHTAFHGLVDQTEDQARRSALRRLCQGLPSDYIAATSPEAAWLDLMALVSILQEASPAAARIRVQIEIASQIAAGKPVPGNAPVNIRLLSLHKAPSLSQLLPALHNAGIAVDREQTHAIAVQDGVSFFVTSLGVDAASAAKLAQTHVTEVARDMFELLFNDAAEDGRLNGLAVEAGLSPREVQLIRAYASYWRQAGCRFSLRYIADCLRNHPSYVRTLIDGFLQRFDPTVSELQRTTATASLQRLRDDLDDINHADTEDILRSLTDLMLATLRTSYFQAGQATPSAQADAPIILKFDSSQLALLPQPRPYRELFVFSRRFEGVHLRGGPVARGGLRWSDRMEDYRTEVLGLVKAQMVKNAVIVPAGAKGGFICKRIPKDAAREAIAAEGEAVYRLFIAGLLELTDNRVRGEVVRPTQTVCYDEADPYLVVAADKGTASFSDIANSIAVARGFWLGDAFASGGSNGYDHKKLGITAKGAWEAVKRHFYEIGHDLNTTPITMTGVGDMSGDVFGNGLLLSTQLKLVAAFDHRHIFIDPNPDVATSFNERQRLFALPRSSWDDYDRTLISEGGGVWPRSARSIALSAAARQALGIDPADDAKDSLTPEQLLHLILLAPVDLFYNGGIGTYIKASSESQAQVKDRANDAIRVDGKELRCKVVAEGGNLGATQAGRIEFALHGGRIFTDAIDNSAGVDCSDHEVNLKIWLDTEVNAGSLSETERNRILNDLAPDIEALVLRDNALQTHLLAREAQAQQDSSVQDGYAVLIASLEQAGDLSRVLEQLPSVAELVQRKTLGEQAVGLTAPELAVVIATVKNRYKRMLAAQPLLDQPWAKAILTPYFPQKLVATRDAMQHPLANAILATVLANEAVNRCGPLMPVELARAQNVSESEVVCAWAQAWDLFNLAPIFAALDDAALLVPVAVSRAVDQHALALQKEIIEGVLSYPERALHNSNTASDYAGLRRSMQVPGLPDPVYQLKLLAEAMDREKTTGSEDDNAFEQFFRRFVEPDMSI